MTIVEKISNSIEDVPVSWEKRGEFTPSQALMLLFEDYKPNTRRAYTRIFADFQKWASLQGVRVPTRSSKRYRGRKLQTLTSLTILGVQILSQGSGEKTGKHQPDHERVAQGFQGAHRIRLPS